MLNNASLIPEQIQSYDISKSTPHIVKYITADLRQIITEMDGEKRR